MMMIRQQSTRCSKEEELRPAVKLAIPIAGLGAFIGGTYGAYRNRDWDGNKTLDTSMEGAVGGGVVGAMAGILYPLTFLIGTSIATSYAIDMAPFTIKIESNDKTDKNE